MVLLYEDKGELGSMMTYRLLSYHFRSRMVPFNFGNIYRSGVVLMDEDKGELGSMMTQYATVYGVARYI